MLISAFRLSQLKDELNGGEDPGYVPLGWHLHCHWSTRLEAQVSIRTLYCTCTVYAQ
jgi:hypothetical protein